jgi:hypothetical protein
MRWMRRIAAGAKILADKHFKAARIGSHLCGTSAGFHPGVALERGSDEVNELRGEGRSQEPTADVAGAVDGNSRATAAVVASDRNSR